MSTCGTAASTSSPRSPPCCTVRDGTTGAAWSSSTAGPRGITPTSGTPCARPSSRPASWWSIRTTAAATATGAAGSSPTATCAGRGRRRTAPERTPSSLRRAATRTASRSPVAATAATSRRRCSRSSPTSGRPASPACRSSITSTRRRTPPCARTCAGGTARTPATSSRTAPASSTTRPSTTSIACGAPLLILAADRDPRCPPRLVGTVVETLRGHGQVCEAHVYADEGHEISGVENHVDYDRRTVEFIQRHAGAAG